MKRRRLIAAIPLLLGAFATSAFFARHQISRRLGISGRLEEARRRLLELSTTAPESLDAPTIESLRLIALALLPDELTTGDVDATIGRLQVRSETERGYKSAVVRGIDYLRQEATTQASSLTQLTLPERRATLQRIMKDSHTRMRAASARAAIDSASIDRLRGFALARVYVCEEILRGYYESPAGWALVGYVPGPFSCTGYSRYAAVPPNLARS